MTKSAVYPDINWWPCYMLHATSSLSQLWIVETEMLQGIWIFSGYSYPPQPFSPYSISITSHEPIISTCTWRHHDSSRSIHHTGRYTPIKRNIQCIGSTYGIVGCHGKNCIVGIGCGPGQKCHDCETDGQWYAAVCSKMCIYCCVFIIYFADWYLIKYILISQSPSPPLYAFLYHYNNK